MLQTTISGEANHGLKLRAWLRSSRITQVAKISRAAYIEHKSNILRSLKRFGCRIQTIWARVGFATAILTMLFSAGTSPVVGQTPTLSVNAGSVRHAINPNIYGINGYCSPTCGGGNSNTYAAYIKAPLVRWGGDGTTRYNWAYNDTCEGGDFWFFCSLLDNSTTAGELVDAMMTYYRGAYSGAQGLITIPIIPYIANSAASCSYCLPSFPVTSVNGSPSYGAQQSEYGGVGVWPANSIGNGKTTGGSNILDTDITYNMVANSTTIQSNWMSHLISTYGNCASGGICNYQLDNEPNGWCNTHRDAVANTCPDYSSIVSDGEPMATVVRNADSTAAILGPSDYTDYGWITDCSECTGGSNPSYAGQYWLQQFKAYDTANSKQTVTTFDEHWYCYNPGASVSAELEAPRYLWDPTYTNGAPLEGTWGAYQLIPRFQSWVSSYYPGLGVSFSEWACEGQGGLTDTLTNADILGVFGYQGVALADEWETGLSQLQYAWYLYRNYDGNGSQFGDTSVSSTSTDPTQATLSVYGALRSSDGSLTVMVINKTNSAIATTLNVSGFTPTSTAEVYTYSNANLNQIVAGAPVSVSSNSIQYSFPSYSATLFILTSASASAPAAPTGLTATVH